MPECQACSSKNIKSVKARVSGFVAARAYNSADMQTELSCCRNCGHAAYALRPDKDAMAKLYNAYRSPAYQQERQKYEPWYTAEVNTLIGKNPQEVASRRTNMLAFINGHLNISAIESVLDFGGDSGQHIPDLPFLKAKYLYDISGVEPAQGVEKIEKFEALKQHNYSLIMCCHTLEHLSDPKGTIYTVKALCGADSFVYFEVPFDSPLRKCKKPFGKVCADGLKRFIKAVLCMTDNRYIMHEHINYFTPKSLGYMVQDCGFEVLDCSVTEMDFGWSTQSVISVLARPGVVPGGDK